MENDFFVGILGYFITVINIDYHELTRNHYAYFLTVFVKHRKRIKMMIEIDNIPKYYGRRVIIISCKMWVALRPAVSI